MSIVYELQDPTLWEDFYRQREAQGKLRPEEARKLRAFIDEKQYENLVAAMLEGRAFSLPTKRLINKVGKTKKRVVYTYAEDENYLLKLLTRLLYKYDGVFSSNLYSFRKQFGVKRAFAQLTAHRNLAAMYTYKVDIHDYFNSVDIELCMQELAEVITDDEPLLAFVERLLREERVIYDGVAVPDSHGIMAGVPLSSFLANVYLRKMDHWFAQRHILYARYSDDIIVFAQSPAELQEYVGVISGFLRTYHLTVNPEKEVYTVPGEGWSFLGIQFDGGETDISPVSLAKVKAKLRRKARALLRWKRKKGLDNLCAVKAFIKYLNKFFYHNAHTDEMTWARWYFPLLTTDKSLKSIDRYALELIRYIRCEKHTKSMYNFSYEDIKALGYTPLVAAFYSKKDGAKDYK